MILGAGHVQDSLMEGLGLTQHVALQLFDLCMTQRNLSDLESQGSSPSSFPNQELDQLAFGTSRGKRA